MAWVKQSRYGGESGDQTVWVNEQTGQISYTAPVESSGQVSLTGGYEGESGGGTQFNYTSPSGAVLTDQAAGAAQHNTQLDDQFLSVWRNPNASSWDKAKAVEERYGIHAVEQAALQGHFKDLGGDLGAYIRWKQDKIADRGFQVNGNPLGLWPVAIGMGVGALAGGGAAGAAGGAAGESAAAGGSAAAAGEGAAASAGGYAMPAATAESASALTSMGLAETAPGVWSAGGAAGTGAASGASAMPAATGEASTTSMLSGPAAAGTGTVSTGLGGALSNPQLLGAAGGALLGGMGGSSSGTTTTTEGIPDWLMPYVKPALDKYSTNLQNYQTDPYGIMPSAMKEFQNTIQGQYLDPSTNKYLEDYFKLGAERIKGSLSPTFGHMQAFGQHSGYNEALSRGLGDYAVGLYGGNYAKERDRQTQMTAAAPAFLGQSSQAQFQPYSQYLQSIGSLGRKKEEPYYDNKFGNILGGAMFGSQFGKAFA